LGVDFDSFGISPLDRLLLLLIFGEVGLIDTADDDDELVEELEDDDDDEEEEEDEEDVRFRFGDLSSGFIGDNEG
jgi:hypothetical protein